MPSVNVSLVKWQSLQRKFYAKFHVLGRKVNEFTCLLSFEEMRYLRTV